MLNWSVSCLRPLLFFLQNIVLWWRQSSKGDSFLLSSISPILLSSEVIWCAFDCSRWRSCYFCLSCVPYNMDLQFFVLYRFSSASGISGRCWFRKLNLFSLSQLYWYLHTFLLSQADVSPRMDSTPFRFLLLQMSLVFHCYRFRKSYKDYRYSESNSWWFHHSTLLSFIILLANMRTCTCLR